MAMSMDFRSVLLYLISAIYLLLVISVSAQEVRYKSCTANADKTVNCTCPIGPFHYVNNSDHSQGCVRDDACTSSDGSGKCGFNGICRVTGNSFNCSCPLGLHFVYKSNHSKGCLRDDPCTSSDDSPKCGFNGICRNSTDNSFICSCPSGFHFVDNRNYSKGCLKDDPCTSSDESGKCGFNGICLVNTENSFNCSCPPGFHFVDSSNRSKGCLPNPSQQLGCNPSRAELQKLQKINWLGNDYAHVTPMNQTACKKACMEDCYCMVVIYGKGNCWKKAMPLRKGLASGTTTAFVKVYKALPPMPPAALPPTLRAFPPTPSRNRKDEEEEMLVIIGISLVICSTLFAVILLIIWLSKCRPNLKALQEQHRFNSEGLKVFSYQELNAATGGFKQVIGRGGFGKVYKGLLPDKRAIAVKELDKPVKKSEQDGEKEFRTEMSIIGASHHKNLVQLYGFCDEGSHRILVYEYMPNGSLDTVLFDGESYLDWKLRVQIALGIARGILYLHEECRTRIFHCDIKPQNILLDENYNAKLSDFGMAKLIGAEQTRAFTVARGTLGYMAPEWQKSMGITVKVDVYSFGVLLLEIICCRKNLVLSLPENEIVLSAWVYNCFKEGRLVKLVEQQQCRDLEPRQLERMVLVGLWCIQEDPSIRPSIKKVFQMLEGTIEIQVPPNPGSSSYGGNIDQRLVESSASGSL